MLLEGGGVEWRIYRYVAGVKVKWKWEYTYRHDNGDQQQQQRKYRFITTMLYNALNNTSIVYVPSGKGKHIVLTSRKFFICALWNSRIVVKCVIAAIKIGFYRFFIEISFWADGFFFGRQKGHSILFCSGRLNRLENPCIIDIGYEIANGRYSFWYCVVKVCE